jgi:hypothetical protein
VHLQDEENKRAQWCMPVISALGRLRQEDHEFEVSLGYIVKLCLKNIRKG